MKLHRYVDHQRLHIVTKDVISLSISVLLLFRHYISHKITFGAPSSGGVLCSACGAFIFNQISSKFHIWIAFVNLSFKFEFKFEYGFCLTFDNQDGRQNGSHLSISAVVVTLTQSFLIRFLPNFIDELLPSTFHSSSNMGFVRHPITKMADKMAATYQCPLSWSL